MKLKDALKSKGSPAEIPNVSRDDLPEFFVEMGYKVGAEIGVYKGEFTEKFLKAGLTMYAIDPWILYDDFDYPKNQARLDFVYEHAKRLLSPYPNCTIIKKTSMEAAENFENESLDFVYIDGNHEFRYIAEDLYEWTKKVKKGGVVSGHDYFFTKTGVRHDHWHVAYVLQAFTKAYGISNWYVLGQKDARRGEKRDKWRSWMFVKP